MSVLLDTNILTRSAQPHHPMHQPAVEAQAILRKDGETTYLVPQNLYEFWVVSTRPTGENGLGLSVADAEAEVGKLKGFYQVLSDTPAILPEWGKLVVK